MPDAINAQDARVRNVTSAEFYPPCKQSAVRRKIAINFITVIASGIFHVDNERDFTRDGRTFPGISDQLLDNRCWSSGSVNGRSLCIRGNLVNNIFGAEIGEQSGEFRAAMAPSADSTLLSASLARRASARCRLTLSQNLRPSFPAADIFLNGTVATPSLIAESSLPPINPLSQARNYPVRRYRRCFPRITDLGAL